MQQIDLVVVSRNAGALQADVQRGIDVQRGVNVHLHRVVGRREAVDRCRWETIARARNQGKRLGNSAWLMFLDDDVVLGPDCLRHLADQLLQHPLYGALAADYLRESRPGRVPVHVGMGATMFRRVALNGIRFRWESSRCECQCCCDDLRRLGYAIGYAPTAIAEHRPAADGESVTRHSTVPSRAQIAEAAPANSGHVLVAFDRNHLDLFRHQFLVSLRNAGNQEPITAVTYGLYPSQVSALRRSRGVNVLNLSTSSRLAPARRLWDFQTAIADLPDDLPLAYWDAGDVLFQGRLGALWQTVNRYPRQLLVVREPFMHPENTAVVDWTTGIRDVGARRHAMELLTQRPYFNAGFAAGTVASFRTYLRGAHQLLHSTALQVSSDWGDQTAMNLYCHTHDGSWQEIEEGWNYCLCGRRPDSFFVARSGRLHDRRGIPVFAVHGNAKTLRGVYGFHHYRQNPLLQTAGDRSLMEPARQSCFGSLQIPNGSSSVG